MSVMVVMLVVNVMVLLKKLVMVLVVKTRQFVLVTSMMLKLTNSIRYHQFHVDVGGDVVDDGVSGEDQKTRQFDTTKVLVVTQTVSGIISPMSDTHWFRVTFVTHHHTVLPRSLWGSTSFIKT